MNEIKEVRDRYENCELEDLDDLRLILNDVLFIAEMYYNGTEFQENHKQAQLKIFAKAHKLLGNSIEDIVKEIKNPEEEQK